MDLKTGNWAVGAILAALTQLHATVSLGEVEPAHPALIGSITLECQSVFDTSVPPENGSLYKMANGLHWNTREAVIRHELLFRVGDSYDSLLVQETERNLRHLPFIRGADCIATANSSGAIDVMVRTYDAWTLEVVANYKRAGGYSSWKSGLADHNFLGGGKTLSAVFTRGDTVSSMAFEWDDPYLLGRKLNYSMSAMASRTSRRYSVGLSRPFYASIVRSALGFSATYAQDHVRTFAGEIPLGSVRKRTQELAVEYGIALGTSPARNRHLTIGLLHHRVDFAAIPGRPPGPMPDGEQLEFLNLGAEWEVLDFVEERHIQKFSHVEDINLGFGARFSVAWAPGLHRLSSTQSQFLPSLELSKGFRWTSLLLLLLQARYRSTYTDGGNSNRIASLDASAFVRRVPYQTLGLHAAFDHGWRLDPAEPLSLGERNGLRGYRRFTGDRRLLFNIEDRIFIRDEVWSLVDVGAAVFYDSGYAWPPDIPLRFASLRRSVGFGLRLAPSRSSNNSPVRIDLAYALDDNSSGSRWSLSILGGLPFGPGSN